MQKTKKSTTDDLYFLPLGGSSEIGMNLNLYGYQDQWIMVDLGITFVDQLGIEVAMPDPSFIEKQRKKLLGLVVTHGHEDHIGAIPYLWSRLNCPIYATPFTAFLIHEKLKEAGLTKQATVIEIPCGGEFTLGPFQIDYVPITHSIPESHVLKITTPKGIIVHTGDWKLDESPLVGRETHVEKLKEIGDEGVLALVCDSTNIFEEGRSGSEAEVRESLIDLIAQQKGRVAVSCFSSNIARLESCVTAAQKTGRKVVLVGRSLERMDRAARHAGYFTKWPKFLTENAVQNLPPREVLMVCTGSQGEPRSALSRIASKTHPRVRLKEGDTVIFSSRIIPGNEDAIRAMQDQLIDQGLIVITDQDDFIHVSGHPHQEELRDMYSWIRPQMLIPVHGTRAHIREHTAFSLECGIPKSLAPANGSLVRLAPEGPEIVEYVQAGRLGIDGTQLVRLEGEHMRGRHQLMSSGVICITLELSKNGHLKNEPQLSMVGVCAEQEMDEIDNLVQDTLAQTIHHMCQKKIHKDDAIVEGIRTAVRRRVNAHRSKKPVVIVHLVK
jgi:ribonuclease J